MRIWIISCYSLGTYHADELIDTSEALLRLNATFKFKLVALLVPNLKPLIKLPYEVRSNFVVDYSDKSPTPVVGWISNIDTAFACLGVMSDTGRNDLILFVLHR